MIFEMLGFKGQKYEKTDQKITGVGDVKFLGGAAEFELGHKETVKITGLPDGLEYVVREASVSDYRTASENSTGTVIDNETVLISFIKSKETI